MADTTSVTYELSNSKDTTTFGPSFWIAFHDLAKRVPCDGCREHAESFMVFFHDLVNVRKGVPIYNKDNYNKWIKRISELAEEKKKRTDRAILGFVAVVVIAILVVTLIKTTK